MIRSTTRFALPLLLALWMPLAAAAQPVDAQPVDSLLTQGISQLTDGATRGHAPTVQQARALFERASASDVRPALSHYYTALASYRLIDLVDDEDRSDVYMDDAQTHLEAALDHRSGWAEANALLALVYGRKAAGGMISGMRYGPKANGAMGRAREAAPNNPRVLLAQGISLYNTPSMWGGDTDEAIARLQEAINRFANTSPTDPLQPNWGHADAYAWLGIAHANDNRPREARTAFENALDIRPGYGWVEHVLMPKLATAE